MKLPADVEWVEDARLFIWRPRGVLDEAVVNKILAFIADQEGKFGRAFNRFTDMSGLDAVDLTFKYVFHVALFRRLSRAGRETEIGRASCRERGEIAAVGGGWRRKR